VSELFEWPPKIRLRWMCSSDWRAAQYREGSWSIFLMIQRNKMGPTSWPSLLGLEKTVIKIWESGVNFINILWAAQIPKAQKDSQVINIFALLGSACVKAAVRTLIKLTPGANPTKLCSLVLSLRVLKHMKIYFTLKALLLVAKNRLFFVHTKKLVS